MSTSIDDDNKVNPWVFTAKNAWRQFGLDHCTDLAAGLTYYAVQAMFPAILALVSVLALVGQSSGGSQALLDVMRQLLPNDAYAQFEGPIKQMINSRGTGLALFIGLATALWSASGYVGAFGRAMNTIYQVQEGRPMVKLRATNLAITLFMTVVAAVILVSSVVSGPIADAIGSVVGLGEQTLTLWGWIKWPVMLLLVAMLVAVLYHFTPNVQQPKFRWLSVGSVFALVVWAIASALFAFYVANAGSYSKTYGALAGVIVMLMWMWITNIALLLGAEVDAELTRTRQLREGIDAARDVQLPVRDDAGIAKAEEKEAKAVEEGEQIKQQAVAQEAAKYDSDGFIAEK